MQQQRKLIPYAGYEPPRLKGKDKVPRMIELRNEGYTWATVGAIIAEEEGRDVPYSVEHMCTLFGKYVKKK